ncbi:MAG: hypothetical protein C5B56_08265, partial [Proteobacteria bacterium]
SRRLALGRELTSRAAVLNALREERSFFAGKHPLLRRLNDRLAQTGLRLDRHLLLVWLTARMGVRRAGWRGHRAGVRLRLRLRLTGVDDAEQLVGAGRRRPRQKVRAVAGVATRRVPIGGSCVGSPLIVAKGRQQSI